MNIYEATVPDRMHHLDLGLFQYQIEYTRELLKDFRGLSLLNEMDQRLAQIPRFPGLKIFSHGLQSIARLTADEYKNLMKVMIFIMDNICDENIQNTDIKELPIIYQEWNKMYIISRYEEFSESDLKKFEVCGNCLLNYVIKIVIKIIKLYIFIGVYKYMGTEIYKNI
jgi:hypothetical protein